MLDGVPDPEVPVLSVRDLGIVRDVRGRRRRRLEVVLTPTYSGCPATEVITESVREALVGAGLGPVTVTQRLRAGLDHRLDQRRRPPQAARLRHRAARRPCCRGDGAATMRVRPRGVACPRCGSADTERLSAFGSTACKALYRCLACREPFEHFKPI